MVLISKQNRTPRSIYAGALGLSFALAFVACNRAEDPVSTPDAEAGQEESRITTEAPAPTRVSDDAPQSKTAAATYLHFGDRTACTWNPGICEHSGAWWPGYLQNAGGDNWINAWQSSGPWTGPVGVLPVSELNPHFHIFGLAFPAGESNPAHTAMRGDWWTLFTLKRGNVRVNFDFTQINVLGNIPVHIWFKNAAGQGLQWSNLGPGRWNLPGATNIQEVHIRAASGNRADMFKIDDLLINPR